jgi:uncharacterized membrane protein YeaQ/YmgE (transglycosylase-associated protein family)
LSNADPIPRLQTTQQDAKEPGTRRKAIEVISWIAIGAFVGLVARRIVPGPDPTRFIVTIILGMAGASLGGFVFGVLGGDATSFEVASLPVATLGAVLLLCVYGLIARRTL